MFFWYISYNQNCKAIEYTLHDNGRGELSSQPPYATMNHSYTHHYRKEEREEKDRGERRGSWERRRRPLVVYTRDAHHETPQPRTAGLVCTAVVRCHLNHGSVRGEHTGRSNRKDADRRNITSPPLNNSNHSDSGSHSEDEDSTGDSDDEKMSKESSVLKYEVVFRTSKLAKWFSES